MSFRFRAFWATTQACQSTSSVSPVRTSLVFFHPSSFSQGSCYMEFIASFRGANQWILLMNIQIKQYHISMLHWISAQEIKGIVDQKMRSLSSFTTQDHLKANRVQKCLPTFSAPLVPILSSKELRTKPISYEVNHNMTHFILKQKRIGKSDKKTKV